MMSDIIDLTIDTDSESDRGDDLEGSSIINSRGREAPCSEVSEPDETDGFDSEYRNSRYVIWHSQI